MKRRSKEINIFSMSALDLFASAMGAFMLITIVLFPFFPNTGDSPERVAEVRAEIAAEMAAMEATLAASQAALAASQQELQGSQSALSAAVTQVESTQQELGACTTLLDSIENDFETCQMALQQTFALVVISWGSAADVDLHVVDPRGNEYYYADDRFDGSNAALEEDNVNGPGNEIWLSPQAIPGDYEIYANLFSQNESTSTTVRGSILHQNGRQELPTVTLSSEGDKPLMARFTIADDGTVTVR